MGTTSPDLLIDLDRSRSRSLRAQIEDELREAIRSGRLAPGTPLPSTRALAGELGVTRGVVVDAYDQLAAEGYLQARTGSGTVVNGTARRHPSTTIPPPAERSLTVDFRMGVPDLAAFPRAAWGRATRAALQALPDADLGYGDPRGLPVLRHALADYLGRVRGVSAEADQVVVCNGFGHGFELLAAELARRGIGGFAVEDPGYEGPRLALQGAGLPFDGVPVDGDGLMVHRLHETSARAVVVTPAHQSPTGVVLSPQRRLELVDWARQVDGIIVEDDYDAEYRYDRRPVGALQGLAPDRIAYSGTTAKSLAPGIRLGWLVLPPSLVDPVVEQRRATDASTSTLLQATFAAFLANGDLDRHLRRARATYRQRRDAVVDALRRWLPQVTPAGVAAGLHVLVELPAGVDEAAVVAAARAAGVGVYPLAAHRVAPSDHDRPGLVLGYGSVTPADAERGVRLLADAIASL